MGTFDLLNLLTQVVRILYVVSEVGDIHPVLIDDGPNEFFLPGIFPKEHCIGPFVFSAIFCDFLADLIQVVDDLHRVLLDVDVVADLIVSNSF